jgi:signal transduction histidine kinase
VHVALHFKDGAAVIDVEDNGSGFASTEVMKSGEKALGLGLLGMRERAEFLAGSLTVRSSPGGGTRITAEIPVPK